MARLDINKVKICERCKQPMDVFPIMSWFTTEIICDKCHNKEVEIREKLPYKGIEFEACGFIPELPLDNFKIK